MAPADRGPGTSELADVGRASSLRRSMLALIDKGGDDAHPANWAPFVVVKALLIEAIRRPYAVGRVRIRFRWRRADLVKECNKRRDLR